MMATFNLPETHPGLWYDVWSLTGAEPIASIILYTSVFPDVKSQTVCCEKDLLL